MWMTASSRWQAKPSRFANDMTVCDFAYSDEDLITYASTQMDTFHS